MRCGFPSPKSAAGECIQPRPCPTHPDFSEQPSYPRSGGRGAEDAVSFQSATQREASPPPLASSSTVKGPEEER